MGKSTPPFVLTPMIIFALTAAQVYAAGDAETFDRLTFHQAPKPLSANAVVSDWPRFLGPDDNCHSPETPLLKKFAGNTPTLVWEIARGVSHTSPVVAGHRVLFIHAQGGNEIIECVDAETGGRFWKVENPVRLGQNFGISDAPRSAPVIDAEAGLVFSLGVEGRLLALRLDSGELAWEKSLPEDFGEAPFFFGYGGSPLVFDDKLIVNTGNTKAGVVALDKTTGKERWRAASGWNGSYASPIAAPINGEPRILTLAGGMVDPPHGGVLCIQPATGKIDSQLAWRSRMFASVLAASPVACGDGRIFITEDYGRGGNLVELDKNFQPTSDWTAERFGAQFQTPLFHQDDGHLYGFTGSSEPGAELVCYDAANGEEKWREGFAELGANLGRTHLLHADGAFWCVGASGLLVKFDLNPGGAKVIDSVELFAAPETWALPALSRGLLFVPENGSSPRLRCYDLRGE
jgi:outer membrane protein assembly factor BamB